MNKRLIAVVSIVLLVSLSRLLPHLPNFTPLAAIALFSGAYIGNRYLALALPLLAMLLSDALMGFNGWAFSEQVITVYGTFLFIAFLSHQFLKTPSALKVGTGALLSSVLFFITTNLAVWLGGYFHQPALYPMNATGLMECYVAAIPFFRNTLSGDLFFNAVLFGGFYLLSINVPALSRD